MLIRVHDVVAHADDLRRSNAGGTSGERAALKLELAGFGAATLSPNG